MRQDDDVDVFKRSVEFCRVQQAEVGGDAVLQFALGDQCFELRARDFRPQQQQQQAPIERIDVFMSEARL